RLRGHRPSDPGPARTRGAGHARRDDLGLRADRRARPAHRAGARLLPPRHAAAPPGRSRADGDRRGGAGVARGRAGVRRPAGARTGAHEMTLRIGNASGFYGDRFSAWRDMLDGGDLDFLTGDYLAELTMLILGRDRAKDAASGYAKTFLRQMEQSLGTALERGVRLVSNAGGATPAGLANALRRLGLPAKIGVVTGDDVTGRFPGALTANAYLGGFGIAECLRAGADVVVTGRVTDASLVVGPAAAHFRWSPGDLAAIARATAAGHVMECGAQATAGNFAYSTDLPDGGRRPGFPIAEVRADGSAVITKHPGTGGAVTPETVTAQLLYEIGAPAYLGPDVVA